MQAQFPSGVTSKQETVEARSKPKQRQVKSEGMNVLRTYSWYICMKHVYCVRQPVLLFSAYPCIVHAFIFLTVPPFLTAEMEKESMLYGELLRKTQQLRRLQAVVSNSFFKLPRWQESGNIKSVCHAR